MVDGKGAFSIFYPEALMDRMESFDPKVKFSKNDLIVKIKYKTNKY